jgi:hypothetical protein
MGSHRVLLEPLGQRDPERMGPYVLLGRLGAGAMGRVYLGRSAAGRLVAVKTVKTEYAEEADFRARFAQEVAAARRVSGVFTAAVVAADADADVPWLATAYVPAPSLDHLVHACGPLPVPAVRWLAAGCAEALESIHEAGLVHRDLKPSNVLVSPDGPRVIDFGVARAVERISLTTTHGSVGTPAYMAPEQARDTRRAIVASDMYSLGSTLLFAATGHAPYRGETVMDILVQLATEPPDLGDLPKQLVDVVGPCLQRDPRRRPTPGELVADLVPYVDSAAGHDLGPSFLPASALALIEQYRQPPAPRADPIDGDGEETFGSRADAAGRGALEIAARSGPGRGGARRPPVGLAGRARSSLARARRRGNFASVIAAVGVVGALVVLGALLGAWIDRPGNQPQDNRSGGNRPPVGDPQPPISGELDHPTGNPKLMVNQPVGDGNTQFVLHGSGWEPGSRVTLRLADGRALPDAAAVDMRGTFNYAVNQGYKHFDGPIPPGDYRITATSPGGRTAQATFNVHR